MLGVNTRFRQDARSGDHMRKKQHFAPRSRNRIRETEMGRTLRAAKKEGAKRVEFDLTTGKASVILANPDDARNEDTPEKIIAKL